MLLFDEHSRRRAELVSASPKAIVILTNYQEMPKQS
jgi:hypothetical protein